MTGWQILRQIIYAVLLLAVLTTIWDALLVDGLDPVVKDEASQ